MTKKELVRSVATKCHITGKSANEVLNAMVETIQESMQRNEPVAVVGFGTFLVKERAGRRGFVPAQKAIVEFPAKKIVKFRPSQALLQKK